MQSRWAGFDMAHPESRAVWKTQAVTRSILTDPAFHLKLVVYEMTVTAKRILVVANEKPLRESRAMLLESAGYSVVSVCSDEDALSLLKTESFGLVLIGRNTDSPVALDRLLRAEYPTLLTLKIDGLESKYPSRITDAVPTHVLDALREMLI